MGIDSGREKLPIEHGTILDRLDRVDVSSLSTKTADLFMMGRRIPFGAHKDQRPTPSAMTR